MINERQETIADVVAKMLEFAETDSQTIGRDVLRRRIQNFARRFEAAHQREVAELRECLKEAIREKCPFTRMSCKHGEPCDYECGTVKWRNALRNEGSAFRRRRGRFRQTPDACKQARPLEDSGDFEDTNRR